MKKFFKKPKSKSITERTVQNREIISNNQKKQQKQGLLTMPSQKRGKNQKV